jgi:hypothetical protein
MGDRLEIWDGIYMLGKLADLPDFGYGTKVMRNPCKPHYQQMHPSARQRLA